MVYAYVLISLNTPTEQQTLDDFLEMKEVEGGHILFGEWDMILKLKLNSAEDVAKFIIDKIRSREEVHLTSTLIVAK